MSISTDLAEAVLSLDMVSPAGLRAKQLARNLLEYQGYVIIDTNGTTRVVPKEEPVFLIRGQDAVGAEAVKAWAQLADKAGASADIVQSALDHAKKMEAWPKKKVADLSKDTTKEV